MLLAVNIPYDFIQQSTYSLQSVCELPPSITTLCCSNFIPLPSDPLPFLLLFGRLKSITQKSYLNAASWRFLPYQHLALQDKFTCQENNLSPSQCAEKYCRCRLLDSVQALKCCTTGTLCSHVNAHFRLCIFPSIQ